MSIDFTKTIVAQGVENGIRWVTKKAPLYDAVNGYAQLPEGHPWRDRALQLDGYEVVDVHGGITYGPDENGWIGFDTLHSADSWPEYAKFWKERGRASLDDEYTIHWTPEMVTHEARKLARQIANAKETNR